MPEIHTVQVVTLPNGVEIQSPVVYLDHTCAWCDDLAVRLEVPSCGDMPEYIDEQWCLKHLMQLWEIARRSNERARQRFSVLRPDTWWQLRVWPSLVRLRLKLGFIRFRLWWLG